MAELSANIAAAARPRAGKGAQLWKDPRLLGLLSVIIGLGLWELAADSFSALILPPPSAVLARFFDPAFLPRLLGALGYSLGALVVGFGLALGLALPLGVVLGRSPTLHRMFDPLINAIYAIPPVAFVPFLIIWFGLFFEGRVALVFMMCFFDILVVVIAGSRDVRRSLVDVGRSFGASRGQCLRLVVFPALTPFLFAALRVGSARAINGMITAELFFAAANLGQIMKRSTQAFDTASALAVVVTICLLGLAAQTAIQLLERRLLSWHLRG
ncbi:taurine ABC transporter permease [Agaricicola taiwanensis]|uniref:Taurine ABC transporter permease n=1 Tax=Agaricicola taiwanensis TaxID=591372 RepID=A0A8J2YJU8_9RHOB|nr:ABC transporter permease [Agaricicola taiwanensis]GGE49155.1 taurine ABC transporter permease [Agaricicola taiwanensis]